MIRFWISAWNYFCHQLWKFWWKNLENKRTRPFLSSYRTIRPEKKPKEKEENLEIHLENFSYRKNFKTEVFFQRRAKNCNKKNEYLLNFSGVKSWAIDEANYFFNLEKILIFDSFLSYEFVRRCVEKKCKILVYIFYLCSLGKKNILLVKKNASQYEEIRTRKNSRL